MISSRAKFWIFLLASLPLGASASYHENLDDQSSVSRALAGVAGDSPRANRKNAEFREQSPSDLRSYLDARRKPGFIRINVKDYNIRTSASFASRRTDNIDFKSKGDEVFPVEGFQPLYYGAAVQIRVDGKLRWIYVPYDRKQAFRFCETEACFTPVFADYLDFFLKGSGVNVIEARACGISSGPEGLILPAGAARPAREPEAPRRVSPPLRPVERAPRAWESPSSYGALSTRPLWELAKGAEGERWTRLLEDALDRYGQGLLRQRSVADSSRFCPNYSRLNQAERREFWIHLFSGIARYESNFKLTKPAFDEQTHENVFRGPILRDRYSMGLFQLSYSAAPAYRPNCRIDFNRDRYKDVSDNDLTIYDARIQTECAVTIMNRWVTKDGGIGIFSDRGGARFWSTLRYTNPATQNVIASLRRFKACWR